MRSQGHRLRCVELWHFVINEVPQLHTTQSAPLDQKTRSPSYICQKDHQSTFFEMGSETAAGC